MYCAKCQNDLSGCTCSDINERLEKIGNLANVAMKWCRECDKHYERCSCETPDWYTRMKGRDINANDQ